MTTIQTRDPGLRLGVVFPQTELDADVATLRRFATGVAELGLDHLLAYDHVVAADPDEHPDWSGPYDVDSTFHEPFVLFGFLAGITQLELVTGVLILPQRQTALVAKQAAEVDVLTGGRFRLGIGLGWNHLEYAALGKSFTDRGSRVERQVALLRRLWSERSLSSNDDGENLVGVGLAPLPVQHSIPIWFGGNSDAAYRRMGRLADGWFPLVPPGPALDAARNLVIASATEFGREHHDIGMEGQVSWAPSGRDKALVRVERWEAAGATHVAINTMGAGFRDVDEHLASLEQLTDRLR